MARTNPAEQMFSPDFSKAFSGFQGFPFDFSSLMETHRRNVQALSDVNRIALESLQEIAQMQSAVMSKIVEDSSVIAREMAAEGTPEEKIALQAELTRKSYEKTVDRAQQIAEAVGKSNKLATEIINRRVAASLNEIKSAAEKSAKGAKHG